jgi:hypothetical protein
MPATRCILPVLNRIRSRLVAPLHRQACSGCRQARVVKQEQGASQETGCIIVVCGVVCGVGSRENLSSKRFNSRFLLCDALFVERLITFLRRAATARARSDDIMSGASALFPACSCALALDPPLPHDESELEGPMHSKSCAHMHMHAAHQHTRSVNVSNRPCEHYLRRYGRAQIYSF